MLSVFVFITIVQDVECLMSYGVLFRGVFVFLTGLAVLTMPLIYWVSKIHSKLQHIKLNLCPMSTKGLHQYMIPIIRQHPPEYSTTNSPAKCGEYSKSYCIQCASPSCGRQKAAEVTHSKVVWNKLFQTIRPPIVNVLNFLLFR